MVQSAQLEVMDVHATHADPDHVNPELHCVHTVLSVHVRQFVSREEHGRHEVGDARYVPAAHAVHAEDVHAVQFGTVAAHELHSVGDATYMPAAHAVHTAELLHAAQYGMAAAQRLHEVGEAR